MIDRKRKAIQKNRGRVLEYFLSHPCIDCGEGDPLVLEFDHVRGVKKGDVCTLLAHNTGWARLEEEIGKCEVRCANCHRRKTAREQGFYAWRSTGVKL